MRIDSRAERGLIESDSGPELARPIGASSAAKIGPYHAELIASALTRFSTDPDSETESESEVDAPPVPNINLVKAREQLYHILGNTNSKFYSP